MRRAVSIITLTFAVLLSTVAQTQQPATPPSKLTEFQMALLKRGPKWSASTDNSTVHRQHIDYVQSLLKSGQAVIAGRILDDSDLVGVYIFRAKSADEARAWVMADPAVVAEYVVPELHPWWSEEVMKKTETPAKLVTVYLAFLVKGEKWTAETTPQTEEIQKLHMANIHRLADMKKLVIAGPFGDDGR